MVCFENYNAVIYGQNQVICVLHDLNCDLYMGLIYNKNISNYRFFTNLIWLEREVSECFGYYFNNTVDSRNLLLEYSNDQYPLKVSNPLESFVEYKTKKYNLNRPVFSQSVEL